MPIKTVATVSNPNSNVLSSSLDDETKSKLYTLVEAYLLLMPRPTDTQMHALAEAVGMSHEELEAVLYEFFGEVLSENSDSEADVIAMPEEIVDLEELSDDLEDENFEAVEAMFKITSGDDIGKAAESDGAPDKELFGESDLMKENSSEDGSVDIEQIKENLGKDE